VAAFQSNSSKVTASVCSYGFFSFPSRDCNGNLRHFLWDFVETLLLPTLFSLGFWGFISVEFFQGDSQRVLIGFFYPPQQRLQWKFLSFSLGFCYWDFVIGFCYYCIWDSGILGFWDSGILGFWDFGDFVRIGFCKDFVGILLPGRLGCFPRPTRC
jgi:hypothetical protein